MLSIYVFGIYYGIFDIGNAVSIYISFTETLKIIRHYGLWDKAFAVILMILHNLNHIENHIHHSDALQDSYCRMKYTHFDHLKTHLKYLVTVLS